MTIVTKWNIGDKVWAVCEDWYYPTVSCKSCNREGGAFIPDTKVWAKCQDCEGEGELKSTEPDISYRVFEGHVGVVQAEDRGKGAVISYHFWNTSKTVNEDRVFKSKNEAADCAEQLRTKS